MKNENMQKIKIIGHVIYCHTCIATNKCYVGQVRIVNNQTPEKAMDGRWRGHVKQTQNKQLYAFQNAILKYGCDSFKHEILEVINEENWDLANVREQFWISEKNSFVFGYNETSGGLNCKMSDSAKNKLSIALKGRKQSKEHIQNISQSRKGFKHSDDTKQRIQESCKGKKLSKESCEKISKSLKGRIFSEEHKRKLSESLKGRIVSEEQRKKLSESTKGRKGHKHSVETCKKISENHHLKGKKQSDEVKKKISESQKGKIFSEEHKRKIGASHKGFKHSEESRKKMSETRKLRNDIKKLGQILMSFYEVGTLYNN